MTSLWSSCVEQKGIRREIANMIYCTASILSFPCMSSLVNYEWDIQYLFPANIYPHSKVHGANIGGQLGPVAPRWAPCCPHEPCYQGSISDEIGSGFSVAPLCDSCNIWLIYSCLILYKLNTCFRRKLMSLGARTHYSRVVIWTSRSFAWITCTNMCVPIYYETGEIPPEACFLCIGIL